MCIIPWNITSPYPHVYCVEPEGGMLLKKTVPYLYLFKLSHGNNSVLQVPYLVCSIYVIKGV